MNKKGSVALIILGIVAITALVGLILLFTGKGAVTGNTMVTGNAATGCTDSDNGKSYNSRGAVGVGTYSVEDTCLRFPDLSYAGPGNFLKDGVYLAEGYCENGVLRFDVYKCPNGCHNGACS
jgi:hypothetical protein